MRVRTVSALRLAQCTGRAVYPCTGYNYSFMSVMSPLLKLKEELITGRTAGRIGRCRVMARTDGRSLAAAQTRSMPLWSIVYAMSAVACGRCFFCSDASSDGVEERSLSLARSAQAERDNESCLFVRAAGLH
ncbi:hypothetical protein EVAR_96731_1 [Eumeta japonica]|uniref:Uncharacterized protein n=1 Tax=Eumeta variegata TaxID=151549 RepID=A0A4C1SU26_EUMVA|nr:hypothetical protein EVAR_96731_1 [Eumeta japonica]